ncbi:UNVERIFIED_ORG: hypothetical protein CLV66_105241 [Actinomadura viridilutea]
MRRRRWPCPAGDTLRARSPPAIDALFNEPGVVRVRFPARRDQPGRAKRPACHRPPTPLSPPVSPTHRRPAPAPGTSTGAHRIPVRPFQRSCRPPAFLRRPVRPLPAQPDPRPHPPDAAPPAHRPRSWPPQPTPTEPPSAPPPTAPHSPDHPAPSHNAHPDPKPLSRPSRHPSSRTAAPPAKRRPHRTGALAPTPATSSPPLPALPRQRPTRRYISTASSPHPGDVAPQHRPQNDVRTGLEPSHQGPHPPLHLFQHFRGSAPPAATSPPGPAPTQATSHRSTDRKTTSAPDWSPRTNTRNLLTTTSSTSAAAPHPPLHLHRVQPPPQPQAITSPHRGQSRRGLRVIVSVFLDPPTPHCTTPTPLGTPPAPPRFATAHERRESKSARSQAPGASSLTPRGGRLAVCRAAPSPLPAPPPPHLRLAPPRPKSTRTLRLLGSTAVRSRSAGRSSTRTPRRLVRAPAQSRHPLPCRKRPLPGDNQWAVRGFIRTLLRWHPHPPLVPAAVPA